jgi:hypothetical protein
MITVTVIRRDKGFLIGRNPFPLTTETLRAF